MRKRMIGIFLIAIVLCMMFATIVKADSDNSYLYLEQLDFHIVVNTDGSMKITETWNIDIGYTNTLFKSFEIDKEKYSAISNVTVAEITGGERKELTKIEEEMYHVTKDCYYALNTSSNNFEIAWGVGLDEERATRQYEISYTVEDAIGKYNDYAELYWQLVGADFAIDADKITGTITLPKEVEKQEDILVWGHTEGLNGEIHATNTNTVKFEVNNFESGRFVEVRVLFPTQIISNSGRMYSENRYDSVIEEESKWAKQANARRQWEEIEEEVITVFVVFLVLALCIIFIEKAVKYSKKLNNMKKYKPDQTLDYFRDLPEKEVTPGEALYLLQEPYNTFSNYFGKIFSATLLNLDLKGYIDLRVEKEEKKKDKIYIKQLKEADDNVKKDEKEILEFIKKASKKKEEIEIKQLENYISSHGSSIVKLIKRNQENIEKQLEQEGKIDLTQKTEYIDYSGIAGVYYVFAIITLAFAFPLAIVFLIDGILCSKIKKNCNVLTQKGIDCKEKWKGLKKYMEDFSLLKEKEVPAIEVWEKYLVYATAFGIAEKVLKQLKTVYPNIDELDAVHTSTYMYFIYHSNFTADFSHSISSSITSSYSSATGGGGGFSGGGGGGRWPEEVAVVDKPLS